MHLLFIMDTAIRVLAAEVLYASFRYYVAWRGLPEDPCPTAQPGSSLRCRHQPDFSLYHSYNIAWNIEYSILISLLLISTKLSEVVRALTHQKPVGALSPADQNSGEQCLRQVSKHCHRCAKA